MSDVDPTDPSDALDKRRNRVTDPDIQSAFLGGVNEARPTEDAIGPQDDPLYEVAEQMDDGTTRTNTVKTVAAVLTYVEKALANGHDVIVTHVAEAEDETTAAVDEDIIDADVID